MYNLILIVEIYLKNYSRPELFPIYKLKKGQIFGQTNFISGNFH